MKDMSDCLVVGDTSQVSQCLPSSFSRVSSRNFDADLVDDYDRIFICFAEQRTFDNSLDFMEVNYDYTLSMIDDLLPKCNDIIFYSTAMLWENLKKYSIDDAYSYDEENNYLVSKQKITDELRGMDKVLVHYPCNFNSTFRKSGYLFSKLVDACAGKIVSTGDLDFNRELVHASYVANTSLYSDESRIIAPGYLTNVRKYFHDVMDHFGVSASNIQESMTKHKPKPNSMHSVVDTSYDYGRLVEDTIIDIGRHLSD
jgi:nucleoside-diphosphate-sugar epimerase